MYRPLPSMLLASTALLSTMAAAQTAPLPGGGRVTGGTAVINAPVGTTLTIDQASNRAAIDWNSFSVAAGHRVDIRQPGSGAVLLNRVTGTTTSQIAGQVTANGSVFLVNPNGILITSKGSVNTAGFVASTLDLSASSFMQGNDVFAGAGGTVTNNGTITIATGGYAALIGGRVEQAGAILAPLGKVALGSGTRATLDFAGDGFLQVALPADGGGVAMSGRIVADGGAIVISAASARAAARGTVNLSGVVEARGISGSGGTVTLTGDTVTLTGATIDVSGAGGGGTVRIGGQRSGGATPATAATVNMDAASAIVADATGAGRGGAVTLWSDTGTHVAGRVSARGAGSGGGGTVELASAGLLDQDWRIDVAGQNAGMLRLEAGDFTVGAAGGGSMIDAAQLVTALGNADVTVTAGNGTTGGIKVSAPLRWTGGRTLSLRAGGDIALGAGIDAVAGGLALNAGGFVTATGAVDVARFTLTGGTWQQNGATLPTFAARDFRVAGGTFLRAAGGAGTTDAPYLLSDIYGLQGIGARMLGDKHYQLVADIDATGTAGWNDGAGFVPLVGSGNWTGSIDGDLHQIVGITIRPAAGPAGLFYFLTGNIRELGFSDGVVIGPGNTPTGALAGINTGQITGSWSDARVTEAPGPLNAIGGLVGSNGGTIDKSYFTGEVFGNGNVGGIAGLNFGTITQSYATGSVVATGDWAGGVTGYNVGKISFVYATGSVTGTDRVGGLIGQNSGSFSQAWSSGLVTGDGVVGAAIGSNITSVTDIFWDGKTGGQTAGVGRGSIAGVMDVRNEPDGYSGFNGQQYTGLASGWNYVTERPLLETERPVAGKDGVLRINNVHQLALMEADLTARYRLVRDMDATVVNDVRSPFGNSGFLPISRFGGSLDGDGHVIRGLVIGGELTHETGIGGRSSYGYGTGLFDTLLPGSSVSRLGLVGGSVDAGSALRAGALAGLNRGTISQVYSTNSVTGTAAYIGGLVGSSTTMIRQSYVSGSVTGGVSGTGGIAGNNLGTIVESYATGAVSGAGNVGGLVGTNANGGRTERAVWNVETTGQSRAVGNQANTTGTTGLTTARMQDVTGFARDFAGWDFDNVWAPPTDAAHSSDGRAYYPELYALSQVTTVSAGGTRVYGDAAATFAVTPGRLFHAGSRFASIGTADDPTTSLSDAGRYAVVARGVAAYAADGSAYRIVYVPGTMTVTPATLGVTGRTGLDRIYDGTTTLAPGAVPVVLTGLRNGDTPGIAFAGGAYADANAGLKEIVLSGVTLTGSKAGNYILDRASVTASGTIAPRPITIAAIPVLRSAGYDNPVLPYRIGGMGLVAGDTLTGSLVTGAGRASRLGSYAITPGSLAASPNYAVTYSSALLTVAPRITVTAIDRRQREQGTYDPDRLLIVTGD